MNSSSSSDSSESPRHEMLGAHWHTACAPHLGWLFVPAADDLLDRPEQPGGGRARAGGPA